jgi:uncharacterized membrane protein YecN with MAPEG domain
MRITGIYAALATLLVVLLAVRISLARRRLRISTGDGGDAGMFLRIRAHANAVENVPLALLLLLLLELNQTQPLWLHICGCVLIAGRVLHAFGMMVPTARFGRSLGIALTWGVMLVMAVLLLWQWIAFSAVVR